MTGSPATGERTPSNSPLTKGESYDLANHSLSDGADARGEMASPVSPPLRKGGLGGVLSEAEWREWNLFYTFLASDRRATTIQRPGRAPLWAAAERLPAVMAAFPEAQADPPLEVPEAVRRDWTPEEARVAMVRGLMEVCGPTTAEEVAAQLGIETHQADACLEALEGEGVVLRGRFTNPKSPPSENEQGPNPKSSEESAKDSQETATHPGTYVPGSPRQIEWCHRRLLARIHRLTIEGLRKQIEPVTVDIFLRFLTRHHGLLAGSKRSGTSGLFETLSMLQGLDLPAVVWERDVLPARIEKYRPEWLDELCLTGEIGWGRLYPTKRIPDRSRPIASLTRVVPVGLFLRSDLEWLEISANETDVETLSSPARQVYGLLEAHGAMFAADLLPATRMLPAQLNDVLGELVAQGLVTADGFAGFRALVASRSSNEESSRSRPRLVRRRVPLAGSGRWSLWRRSCGCQSIDSADKETRRKGDDIAGEWAWQLLRRWGVVFRDLLEREPGAQSGSRSCRFCAGSKPAGKFAADDSSAVWRGNSSRWGIRCGSCDSCATKGPSRNWS